MGVSFDSKFFVKNFGLGTGSWFCVLAKHRSAIRIQHKSETFVDDTRFELVTNWLKASCSAN